jgi:hypothetical protein
MTSKRTPWKRARTIAAIVLSTPILLLVVAWACGALYYTFPVPSLRFASMIVFAAGCAVALVFLKNKLAAVGVVLLACLVVLGWFLSIAPTNDRPWRTEVAVMPWSEIHGDDLTVHAMRNFDYRTPDDYDVRYADKRFDMSKLRATDIYFSYWDGNRSVAHTMFSWDFGGADVLCLSVEIRREVGQADDTLAGIYKQFEILYILADERDVVRLRTNYRREEVYLFRTLLTPDESRRFLTEVLSEVNDLRDHPQFYRTLGNNCTTSVVSLVDTIWPGRIPFSKKILMNGLAPEIAYEKRFTATDLPFEEWKSRGNIGDAARAADTDPLFSRRIRAGRYGMDAGADATAGDVIRTTPK